MCLSLLLIGICNENFAGILIYSGISLSPEAITGAYIQVIIKVTSSAFQQNKYRSSYNTALILILFALIKSQMLHHHQWLVSMIQDV